MTRSASGYLAARENGRQGDTPEVSRSDGTGLPCPSSTWVSTSADQVLRSHQRSGQAHLRWLTD
jgi:hypothetical protein